MLYFFDSWFTFFAFWFCKFHARCVTATYTISTKTFYISIGNFTRVIISPSLILKTIIVECLV